MLLLVTSQSVKMNGRQYASLLKILFLVVKYHLIAIFQLYGLLQLSLSKLSLYSTVKDQSVTCKIITSEMSVLHKTYLSI